MFPRVSNGDLEIQVSSPVSGLLGYVDSQGVLRTEKGTYDPLAGQVRGEPSGSPERLADVIDLQKRLAGEQ